jgi:hypothetical protein
MTKIEEKAAELSKTLGLDAETQATLAEAELNVLTRPYTLADAIREGATVTSHSTEGWGDGESACALSAAVIAATAHGYL